MKISSLPLAPVLVSILAVLVVGVIAMIILGVQAHADRELTNCLLEGYSDCRS